MFCDEEVEYCDEEVAAQHAELDAIEANRDSSLRRPQPIPPSARSAPAAKAFTDVSENSGAISLATAPARLTSAHCFLPSTLFQRWTAQGGGQYVAAAELRNDCTDVLLGPNGAPIHLTKVVKHKPLERDVVKLMTEGGSCFEVTADHRLVARGPSGESVEIDARDIRSGSYVHNGTCFLMVDRFETFVKSSAVVEITFSNESGIVLAWWLPRRPRSGNIKPDACIAALGRRVSTPEPSPRQWSYSPATNY